MYNVNITNSFRIRSVYEIDDLKKAKIKALKEKTQEIILEKYPFYKQINSGKNGEIIMEISKIRSLCNKLEEKIKSCQSEEQLLSMNFDENYLRRAYGI